MKFFYQARSKTGKIQAGTVEASDRDSAFELLKSRGLYVTSLEKAITPVYAKKIKLFERVSNKEIVAFSRQLAIMFKSKVPIVETFRTLAQQTKNDTFREKILKIAEEVEGGTSLSQALSMFPKLFSPFYINMVKSGEASGKLTDVFLYLADYLERESAFRSKIKGAMIYPLFILFVFVVVFAVVVVYVIPQLTAVLEETGKELPWITLQVMGLSNFMRTKGWIILIVLAAAIFGIYRLLKTKKGKAAFDQYVLRMPILKGFLKKLYLSRFALNLSTLISGGLPIAQSLEITGEVVGNTVYRNIILETKEEVRKGETISSVLNKHSKYISPFFFQMVSVGEKTGTLDSSLANAVDFYQDDVERALEGFVKILEPLFIIILGLIVAGLLGAVLMPLYSMGMV